MKERVSVCCNITKYSTLASNARVFFYINRLLDKGQLEIGEIMFSKMLDNQNCLCVVSASNGKWKSFIEKAENIPECKEDSPYKKIILNRSEFINKYKSIYGMIIP